MENVPFFALCCAPCVGRAWRFMQKYVFPCANTDDHFDWINFPHWESTLALASAESVALQKLSNNNTWRPLVRTGSAGSGPDLRSWSGHRRRCLLPGSSVRCQRRTGSPPASSSPAEYNTKVQVPPNSKSQYIQCGFLSNYITHDRIKWADQHCGDRQVLPQLLHHL